MLQRRSARRLTAIPALMLTLRAIIKLRGGAIASHIRVETPWFIHFLRGFAAWAGLTLRHPGLIQIIIKP